MERNTYVVKYNSNYIGSEICNVQLNHGGQLMDNYLNIILVVKLISLVNMPKHYVM